MTERGRPKAELVLTDEERETLTRWARRAKSSQRLAIRSRVVLECATGATNRQVALRLQVSRPTVGKWRSRFVAERLDGLIDEPRPGAPRTITDEKVEQVLTDTLEKTPNDATHWSRSSMAKRSGLSPTTVGRIWKAFRLQPHRSETFKLSTDPQFIEKTRDVVGLYLDPPESAMVLCVDEKSQVQALDRSQPVLPMMPGMPEKRTHDYARHGITSLFAALDMTTGKVISQLHRRHRSIEYRAFLNTIDKSVPAELDVHVICDNYATHKTDIIQKWLADHPRFTVHFIPTGSSWLNMVERWFGELTTKLLQRGVHKSVQALEADIRAWIENWNSDPRPYVWTKTADEILESIAAYCQRISGQGH
jgi:transposase